MALANIQSIDWYLQANNRDEVDEKVGSFVVASTAELPWYFKISLKLFAGGLAVLCFLMTGKAMDKLSPQKRQTFLRRISFIPLLGLLNKLIRSMAFLKLFDEVPNPGVKTA